MGANIRRFIFVCPNLIVFVPPLVNKEGQDFKILELPKACVFLTKFSGLHQIHLTSILRLGSSVIFWNLSYLGALSKLQNLGGSMILWGYSKNLQVK